MNLYNRLLIDGGRLAVAGTHFNFVKPISIFDRYSIKSRIVAWDDKWVSYLPSSALNESLIVFRKDLQCSRICHRIKKDGSGDEAHFINLCCGKEPTIQRAC